MAKSCQKKHCLGAGAKCWVLFDKLHPKPSLLAHCPNPEPQKKVDSLVATRMDTVTRQGQTAIFFVSKEFPDEELYCALQYCHVIEQGPQDDLFKEFRPSAVVAASANESEHAGVEQNIDPAVFAFGNRAEDIDFVRNQGLKVDDNNEPAPENVPLPNQ